MLFLLVLFLLAVFLLERLIFRLDLDVDFEAAGLLLLAAFLAVTPFFELPLLTELELFLVAFLAADFTDRRTKGCSSSFSDWTAGDEIWLIALVALPSVVRTVSGRLEAWLMISPATPVV